jgi:hypothetical protein
MSTSVTPTRTRPIDNAPATPRADSPAPAASAALQQQKLAAAFDPQAIGGARGDRARPSLEDVRREYQVRDDETAEWTPKAYGLFPIPFAPKRELTKTEGRLLDNLSRDRGLAGLRQFSDINDQAFSVSEARYPDPVATPPDIPASERERWRTNDGHRDAFRHAYWNARLTKTFGEEWTAQFTTAHEAYPNNNPTREAMDLHNNQVGREIARANPKASDEELAGLIDQAVKDGRLIVIDSGGELAWSDGVPYGQHGLAKEEKPVDAGKPVPEGDASAKSG